MILSSPTSSRSRGWFITWWASGSLRLRLYLLAAITALPLIAFATFMVQQEEERIRTGAEVALMLRTRSIATLIDRDVQSLAATVQDIAADLAGGTHSLAEARARIAMRVGHLSAIHATLTPAGPRDAPPGAPVTVRSAFAVGDPDPAALMASVGVALAPPEGQAVLRLFLPQAVLQDHLRGQILAPRRIAAIIDPTGRVIARSEAADRYVGTAVIPAVEKLLSTGIEGVTHALSIAGVASTIAVAPARTTGFAAAVSMPDAEFSVQQHVAVLHACLYGTAIALPGLLFAGFLARSLGAALTRASDDLAAGRAPGALFSELDAVAGRLHAAIATATDSERDLRQILDALPLPLVVSDASGQALYINSRGLQYGAGLALREPDGRDALIHPLDRPALARFRERLYSGVAPGDLTLRCQAAGEWRWHRVVGVKLPGAGLDDGKFVTMLHDVHDTYEANRLLADSNRLLEARVAARTAELAAEARRREEAQAAFFESQKFEALGNLTAGIAHDFNNALSAIRASVDTVAHLTSDARIAEVACIAAGAVDSAANLVRQLRVFARRQPLAPKPVDTAALLSEFATLCRLTLGAGIDVVTELPAALGGITVDRGILDTALLNLVLNARDAMPDGGRLTIAAANVEADPPMVCITIRDTGCGMAAETIAHATEPFYTTRRDHGGSGMGLAMVEGFVHGSSGRLEIESRPGGGTAVSLLLPRTDASVAAVPRPQTTGTGVRRFLVVDDNLAVRHSTAVLLHGLGFEVEEAGDGAAALDILAAAARHGTPFDVVLSDVTMPGMSGLDLATRIAVAHPDLRVILMSGYQIARPDRWTVLTKPLDLEELFTAIDADAHL